jgi:hypothetical protein
MYLNEIWNSRKAREAKVWVIHKKTGRVCFLTAFGLFWVKKGSTVGTQIELPVAADLSSLDEHWQRVDQ